MGTAIKHPVPDRAKLSFAIFDNSGCQGDKPLHFKLTCVTLSY